MCNYILFDPDNMEIKKRLVELESELKNFRASILSQREELLSRMKIVKLTTHIKDIHQ